MFLCVNVWGGGSGGGYRPQVISEYFCEWMCWAMPVPLSEFLCVSKDGCLCLWVNLCGCAFVSCLCKWGDICACVDMSYVPASMSLPFFLRAPTERDFPQRRCSFQALEMPVEPSTGSRASYQSFPPGWGRGTTDFEHKYRSLC